MPDPTRTHDSAPAPSEDPPAALPAEPGTATAGTHTHAGEPPTMTGPRAESTSEPHTAPPGFELVREIGSGGMGVVYEARQTRLNRRVALKMLRAGRGDAKDIVRFLTEAEAVAAGRHSNVVQVHEFGQHDGRPFMVLEYLPGGTLSDRLKSAGRLEPRIAAVLVARLAGAVQALHDLGIVHRDLKPSNVLFESAELGMRNSEQTTSPDGSDASRSALRALSSALVPKITDFGLAKRDGGSDLTRTQAVMGTPAYMAPEQAKGDTKFVGPPADIYALGVILYECLSGKRPFDADDSWAILQKVIHSEPPGVRTHVPGVPRDLELIALKCLEKNPADRYPSAAALGEDLERFLAGKPVSVHPAGRGERFVKWCRRNPVVAGFSAALMLVGLVGFAAVSWALMKAENRGKELAKVNDDLTSTNDDLTKSRNDLATSMQDVNRARRDAEARGYLSDVALAHQLWKSNDLIGMRAVLGACPPERRKWEWHHLHGLARPERESYETDSLALALKYSPDGKLLAYLTLDGTLSVRDLAAGTVRTWPTPDADLDRHSALAFHPNGGELAYIARGRVWVVELASGKVRELVDRKLPPGNPGNRSGSPSIAVGYTADGRLLAASHTSSEKPRSRTFTIREAESGKPIVSLPGYEEPSGIFVDLAAAAFSPDGTRFAVSIIDSGIRISNKDEPKKIEPFRPLVMVWDASTGKQLWKGEGGGELLGDLAFGPEGEVGFGRGQMIHTTLGHSATMGFPSGHAGIIHSVAFGPDGLIWSGGEDKLIYARRNAMTLWPQQFALRGCPMGVVRLAVSPDGKEIAASVGELLGSRGGIYRFDAAALRADVWQSPTVRTRPSLVVALSPDGARFAACDFTVGGEDPSDARFLIRRTAGGAEHVVKPAGVWLRGAFRPDGGLIVLDRNHSLKSFGADGKPSGEYSPPVETFPASPPLVVCSPDGRKVAVVAGIRPPREMKGGPVRMPPNARLTILSADTLTPSVHGEADLSSEFPPGVNTLLFPAGGAINPAGTRAATAFALGWQPPGQARVEFRGVLVVWDVATGKELFRKVTSVPLFAVAFDPSGQVVAAGGQSSGAVMGWNIETGKPGLTLSGHTRPILSLAFGPDGRLATGGADRVVKVWDTASSREMFTLDGFAREVTHVAFTKDGKDLVAATGVDLMTIVGGTGLAADWPPAEVRIFRGPK